MLKKVCICLIVTSSILSSCSSFLYHDAIEQGQMPQASIVKKIHVGMNEKAVVQLLGEPTLVNPLYPNKWAYVHTHAKAWSNEPTVEKLELIFENGVLKTIR